MKLKDWLIREKRTQAAFAAEIDVSQSVLSGYIDGTRWPGRDKLERIFKATAGDVTPNDFVELERAAE